MFENLQEGIQSAVKTLRGKGRLTEANMTDGLKLVEQSLLDADVSYSVVQDFMAKVKVQAMGEHVLVAFGKAARVACGGDGDFALEAAIVGIVDDFDVPSAPEHWRMEPPAALAGKGGKG